MSDKHHKFVLYDERLNRFKEMTDLQEHLNTLGAIVEDFRVAYPIADINFIWPPEHLIIPLGREESALRVLYRVFYELMDQSSYPVTMLQRLSVESHEPRKTTVLQLSPQVRRLARLS